MKMTGQQFRTHTDYLGHRVVLKQFIELGFPPDNIHLVPGITIRSWGAFWRLFSQNIF